MEPYWTLVTGSIPFWMVFNTEGSFAALRSYLSTRTFEEVYLTLFSHGVNSIGLPSIADWRSLLRHTTKHGSFIGVDERAFPRDFAIYARYHDALLKTIRERHPLPDPLTLNELDHFLQTHADQYRVEWIRETQFLAA